MAVKQYSLALIPHKVDNGLVVPQRQSDGYINATAMCHVAGKKFNDYARSITTKEFVAALSDDTGIPATELIQSVSGGDPGRQGSWVHPDVAINLAQWLSAKFAVMVSKWVREWMAGGKFAGGAMPYHLQRYMANRSKIPYTHFSILNELTIGLIAPLEDLGYRLPENLMPDISQGKMFAKWMRETVKMDTDTLPLYDHEFADGRVVKAKLYPIAFLDIFRHHFNEVWIPTKAVAYFENRDPSALPFITRILALQKPASYSIPVPKKTAALRKRLGKRASKV